MTDSPRALVCRDRVVLEPLPDRVLVEVDARVGRGVDDRVQVVLGGERLLGGGFLRAGGEGECAEDREGEEPLHWAPRVVSGIAAIRASAAATESSDARPF